MQEFDVKGQTQKHSIHKAPLTALTNHHCPFFIIQTTHYLDISESRLL